VEPGLLFDMNGVITDDEMLHEGAFRSVLADVSVSLTHEEYIRYFAGRSDASGLSAFLAEREPSLVSDADELQKKKAAQYKRQADEALQLYPDVPETLHALRTANYAMALVTGATRAEVEAVLRVLGDNPFEAIVSAEDVRLGKPAPDGYIKAAQNLGKPASECIVVEDSPVGVESARRAGMYCIAVMTTHSADELSQADKIVGSLGDVCAELADR
jgi:HAD superfamily hydrolase (TIGR01509 family)